MPGFLRRIAHLLSGLLCLGLAAAVWGQDSVEALDRHFRDSLSEQGVPGGVYAVVRNGQIERVGTHGVRRAGTRAPVTAQTVFRTASVSKTFAGQLTAMVVADGHLRWDDPVLQFVPDLRMQDPGHARQLQVQHLLSQTTGVVPNAFDNLLNASGVADVNSSFVLRAVKTDAGLPLPKA